MFILILLIKRIGVEFLLKQEVQFIALQYENRSFTYKNFREKGIDF